MFGKKPPSESQPPSTQNFEENSADNDGINHQDSDISNLPSVIPSQDSGNNLVNIGNQSVDTLSHQLSKTIESAEDEILIYTDQSLETPSYREAKINVIKQLVDNVDFSALQGFNVDVRRKKVSDVADSIISKVTAPLTANQLELLRSQSLDEILGLGPLEPLLSDHNIADIMINTANTVFIEKSGKVYLTDVKFLSEEHLMGIITRIVSRVGRRVDESSPMVDARLEDGSRFNAIIPPLALDGCLVSIRKFKKNKMPLTDYINYNSMSPEMCRFLEICSKIRLNILVSGGTGSGKTTLLNALSGHIDKGERVITIEDAAEIQLHQPHVLRLETRPASTEGAGEVTQRQLVKNALRMRPDRIILGEIRGDEVIDVLAAMNTGHDGSMSTIHANNPRDCLARVENLVGMSGVLVSESSLRYQISSAINLVVQLQRMRDGRRRITQIEEIVGVESNIISTQTLFQYRSHGINAEGILEGKFECSGIRPKAVSQAEYFGLDKEMLSCIGML